MTTSISVANLTHPYYDEKFRDWQKWRYTYEGGQRFIDNYLQRYSKRESKTSFERRRGLTYNPAFAKQALEEIRNSIFQRLSDTAREGGSKTYREAMKGESGGVDLLGSSMSSFIGRKTLPELLVMGRVGIYVDMPEIAGLTLADANGKRPYVYIYRAEDIRSWSLDESTNENEFTNILLRDYVYTYNNETGLPTGLVSRFRRLWVEDGTVKVQFFNQTGTPVDVDGQENPEAIIELNISRIPFILVQLGDSLLADVANYQIALLNLASSDLAYALFSNFPFYTEQYNTRAESQYTRRAGQTNDAGGEAADAGSAKTEEVNVGSTSGRRYPVGTERPAFVHPSSEPLEASMKKQEQIKQEIRELVHLAVQSLAVQRSAESIGAGNEGLESGLSYIGLELENMERKIADYWAMYEKGQPASVFYPETYDIKSDAERRDEADQLLKMIRVPPSITGQKAIAKLLIKAVLGRKVATKVLHKIYAEIDASPGGSADVLTIVQDVTAGYLDLKTAAQIIGYPDSTVDKAADDHADRLARIQEAQTPKVGPNGAPPDPNMAARGVPDQDGDPLGSASKEKDQSKDTTTDAEVTRKVRGQGKKPQP